MISQAFLEIPLLAEIAAMQQFEGNSLEGHYIPDAITRDYSWVNTNLALPGGMFGHAHMTGLKTGFTTPAGPSLAGSAYNNGLHLISIVSNSMTTAQDPGRWQDTRRLMDFGFDNFAFREIITAGDVLEVVDVENPQLGTPIHMEVVATAGYTVLLSHLEYASLRRVITYDPLLLVLPEDDEVAAGWGLQTEVQNDENAAPVLRAPMLHEQVVGRVQFSAEIIGGGSPLVLFETEVMAGREVPERTFDTDMDYYIAMVLDNIFTSVALPYWFGFIGTFFGFFGIGLAVTISRRARKMMNRWDKPERPRVSRYERR